MKKNAFRKLIGKKSTGIIITILTFVIIFGSIFAVPNLTMASDSLPGIVDIRNDMTDPGTYRVLEIVPDLEVAQFGYLVGGEEPLDVATLYDSTTKDWLTWQEYLTKYTETMDETDRIYYLNTLVANNADYINIGAPSADKPMWYKAYTETGVTPETAENVLYGGNTPVHGWLISDDLRGIGWNAKFSRIDGKTYTELIAETTPYYIVDTVKADAEVALTEADMTDATYPDHYYTYKKDVSGMYYVPSITFGELKADFEDGGLVDVDEEADELANYFILKFKMLTEADFTATSGPIVYMATDFAYLDTGAPYTIPEQTDKGHNLVKPSDNIYYQGGLYSNEMFKQYSLDIDAADVANYNVDVQTVTAGELNAMSREDLIAYLGTIDFIYLNAGDSTYKYVYNNASLDLDTEAVELIFEKICNEKTPCIVDYYLKELSTIHSDITNTKVYALVCMLMQEDYRSILSDGEFNVDIEVGSSSVASWGANIVNKNSYNYVNGNVMVINSTLANNKLTDNYCESAYESSVVSDAYQAVLDEIELENLYRDADQTAGYAPLSTDIYKATVVRYIMNFVSARTIETKTSIEVLEIQPGNVQYPENSGSKGAVSDTELTPARIRKWLGADNSVSVNITTMNTMEFVGTIEDLNSEYDLIYIGADIYGLPKRYSQSEQRQVPDYKEVTGYASMDYLIYTNVGGLTSVKSQFAGHLDTDWVSSNTVKNTVLARYNGNDITADKHNALVDYVKGTYPIVVADILCSNSTTPDSKRVDNCTYLYSFLNEHLQDDNVFKASEVEKGNDTNFKFYANRGKLNIGTKVVASEESSVTNGTAFVQPGMYATTNDTTDKHVTYISKENNKYYLKYKFTITNNGAVYDSTKYTAALFLDSNSDGKFSAEYEEIPDITLTHVASGKTVKNGELVAGEQYTLTRQVPDSFSGVLTWKVEVSQTNNKFIRDSITGYTRLAETEKVVIKVLQVRRDGGSPLILENAIGNSKGAGNNNTLSSLVWGGYCSYDKVTYKGITDDFQFHFTTMTNAQFNKAYKNKTWNGKAFNLMDYDMLVLGFYDSYDLRYSSETDIDYNAVNGKNGIKEYIDSGKSVLFAHDTTSVTVVPNYSKVWVQNTGGNIYTSKGNSGANVWGYNLNMYIRDMVGLDTYGITLTTKDGIDFSEVNSGKDLSTYQDGQKLMAALKNDLDGNGYYKIGLKPLAYLPNSNKTQTVGQTQGFLYNWMDWHWTNDSTTYRAVKARYNTDRAERVNEGQITTYPYYLDETIDITRTHHQYFTLDLNTDDDGDGETDLVVWYTMGGKDGDKSHQDRKKNSNGTYWYDESNFDDASEKDVMNSYYIYNKGNITYTGFGDFDNTTWRDRAVIVEECKLFVNTLVAAYNASVKEPQITVYESEDNLTPTTTFYEYGDVDNEVAFRENTQRMYFSVNDLNVIRGTKTATAEYYVQLKPGTIAAGATTYTTGGKTYTVYTDSAGGQFIKLTDLKTYTATGQEVSANALQCGVVYYVDIPTSAFDIPGVDGQNVNTFMLAAKTVLQKTGTITGNITTVTTSTTYSTVEFVHVELFPLD